MHWKILTVLPVIVAMLLTLPAYSASSIVSSVVTQSKIYEDISVEGVNPSLVSGAGESEVGGTNAHSAVLREELKPVCSCESSNGPYGVPQQFHADGSVVKGRINPKDIGQCQINLDYWGATALTLGHNIYTSEGNIEMANHIYDNFGLQPWSASHYCWAPALQTSNLNESHT